VKTIVGKKVGMTRIVEDGKLVAATVIQAEPCIVTQVKTVDTDGYNAIQIGCGSGIGNKPQQGHAKKAGSATSRFFIEFRVENPENEPKLGEAVTVDSLAVGDVVNSVGISKGHGFTGTVKRHNFRIGPRGHGGMNQRRPGSIGSTYPQRVLPGKKMAGRMGGERVTVKHLKVLDVLLDQQLIVIKGSVPGVKGARIILQASPRHQAKREQV